MYLNQVTSSALGSDGGIHLHRQRHSRYNAFRGDEGVGEEHLRRMTSRAEWHPGGTGARWRKALISWLGALCGPEYERRPASWYSRFAPTRSASWSAERRYARARDPEM